MASQAEIDWIRALSAKAVESYDLMLLTQARDARAQQIQQAIDERTARLREDLDIKMKSKKGKPLQLLSYEERDQVKEFDTDDLQDGYQLNDQDIDRYMDTQNAMGELLSLMDGEAEWPEVDASGDPVMETVELDGVPTQRQKMKRVQLFDDQQKGTELYHPMVRQGLLPENFVPDRYSETQEMIEGSFELYKAELDETPPTATWRKGLGLASLLVTVATPFVSIARLPMGDDVSGSIATSILAENLSIGLASSAPVAESIVAMGMDTINLVVNIGDDIAGLSGPGQASTTPPATLANLIAQQVCSAVSTRLEPIEVGMMVSSTFMSVFDHTAIVTELIKRDGEWLDAVADSVAGSVAVAAAKCDRGDDVLKGAGLAAKTALASALKDGNNKAALVSALDVETEDIPGFLKDLFTHAEAALTGHLSASEILELTTNKQDVLDKVNAFRQEEITRQQTAEELERSRELAALKNEEDAEKVASLLARKIATYERNHKLYDYAEKTSGLGLAVAAAIFGPMAIAGSLEKLILNIARARDAADDLAASMEARQNMLNAASAFSAPLQSFIKENGDRAIQYRIAACTELINLAGAITETAGLGAAFAPAVAAGKIMQSAAGGAAALQTVVVELNKQYKVSQAWDFYRASLMRPKNRKLALKALQKNPTLALWGMAWGAVVKKDVLVKDFVTHFNITAEDLRDPKVSTAEVKKYLELKQSESITVTGEEGLATGWEPGDYALTIKNWTTTQFAAEKKAKLIKSDPSAIIAGFARLEDAEKALATATTAHGLAADAFEVAAQAYEVARGGSDQTAKRDSYRDARAQFDALVIEIEGVTSDIAEVSDALTEAFKAVSGFQPMTAGTSGPILHDPMFQVKRKFQNAINERRKELRESAPVTPARPIPPPPPQRA